MKYHRIYDRNLFRIPRRCKERGILPGRRREVWSFLKEAVFELNIETLKEPEIKSYSIPPENNIDFHSTGARFFPAFRLSSL